MDIYPVLKDTPSVITKNLSIGKSLDIFSNIVMKMFYEFKAKYDKLDKLPRMNEKQRISKRIFSEKYYSIIEMQNHLVDAGHDTHKLVIGIKLTVEGWSEEHKNNPDNKILLDLYESEMVKGYFDDYKNVRVDCIKKEK
jgi:hypothetical protein